MTDWTTVLTLTTACGAGVVGGVFFAFSTFVMRALEKLPPAQGLAAMQSINVMAINVPFMALLFGTAMLCVGLSAGSLWDWQRPGSGLRLAGSLIYLIGVIGMTIAFHVPRNDTLAMLDSSDRGSEAAWRTYSKDWTTGNHVRTVSGIASAALIASSAFGEIFKYETIS